MNSGKRFKGLIIVIFLAVIIIGGGVFAYFKWFRNGKEVLDLTGFLSEIDYSLQNGFYNEVEDSLEQIKNFSGNSQNWLSILKRVDGLCRGLDDYSLLEEFAEIASKDLPGNEDVQAVYTYCLLKNGSPEKAFEHAKKNINSGKYGSLIAESAIRIDSSLYDEADLEDNEYYMLVQEAFQGDPIVYEEIAEKMRDDRLFAAASLAWMMQGHIDKAMKNILRTESAKYKLLKYYLFYDAGEYDQAMKLLGDMEFSESFAFLDSLKLKADLYMAMENYDKALVTYNKIIQESPTTSWVPYLNAAWIHTSRGNFDTAADSLISAYDIFPQKHQVTSAFSIFLLQVTRIDLENNIILRLEEGLQDHSDMLRVYNQAILASKSPERYKTILWELFNQNPENIKIAQYFAWYLIGIRDMDDLHLILEKSVARTGPMEWTDFFYGLINSIKGKTDNAEQYFMQAFDKVDRWETAYNLAILYLQYGDSNKALDYFRIAESGLVENHTVNADIIAQIRVKMAWIHYTNKQYEAAKRQVSYALDIDYDNLEGQLLRKKLEAETKR